MNENNAEYCGMLTLKIAAKREIAENIWEFELVAPDGGELPLFTAGGHIPVETPSGAMRHYSLSNSPAERNRYVIAVKREPESRGGSRSLVEETGAGDEIRILVPENNFPLEEAPDYILIAGGIGITPILAMARELSDKGKPFKLIYCSRSPEQAAYLDVLRSGDIKGEVLLHHDGGDPEQIFDFWDLLETPRRAHVYCCGPKPLMEEVEAMSGHWPAAAIHFEDFKPVEAVRAEDRPFKVRLAKSGKVVEVPADRTILEALREAGVTHASSCESGTCGTCKTEYLEGDVEHRDMVLMEEEKSRCIMICVSRARSGDLVLDL